VGVDATVFGPEKGRREQVHTLERANACAGEGKCVRLIVLVLLLLRCLHFSLPHLGTAAGFSSWWGGGGGASHLLLLLLLLLRPRPHRRLPLMSPP
jgi:hypothetical protein